MTFEWIGTTTCRDCGKQITLNEDSVRYSCSHHDEETYEMCKDCVELHLGCNTKDEKGEEIA